MAQSRRILRENTSVSHLEDEHKLHTSSSLTNMQTDNKISYPASSKHLSLPVFVSNPDPQPQPQLLLTNYRTASARRW